MCCVGAWVVHGMANAPRKSHRWSHGEEQRAPELLHCCVPGSCRFVLVDGGTVALTLAYP